MAVRAETRVFGRPAPYLLRRGVQQTITAPIRDPSDGSLVAPSSGTVTILDAEGDTFVSEASVTISSSVATYAVTPTSSETLGAGWEVRWTLAFSDAATEIYRESAYLCEYVPPNNVSALDLYRGPDGIPDLEFAIPQSQGSNGDNVGWQPQIDAAYYALIRFLVAHDRGKPWLIREVSGYYEVLCAWARRNALATVRAGAGSDWAEYRRQNHGACQRALGNLRVNYSDEATDKRRGQAGAYHMHPVGRPQW